MPVRQIILTKSFEKSYRKFVKGNVRLKDAIGKSIAQLEEDAFSSQLKTHKLSGNLYGLYACSCGYDCRIVFSIEKQKDKEVILLVDIGTHEDVY